MATRPSFGLPRSTDPTPHVDGKLAARNQGREEAPQAATAQPNNPTPSAQRPKFGRAASVKPVAAAVIAVESGGAAALASDAAVTPRTAEALVLPGAAQSRPRFGSKASVVEGPPAHDDLADDEPATTLPDEVVPSRVHSVGAPKSSGARPQFGRVVTTVEQTHETDAVEIVGRLDNLRTINDWAVGSVWVPGLAHTKITGVGLGDLSIGLEYSFVGVMKDHPVHGRGLEVVAATPHISPDPMAIAYYIAGHFKGIGIAKADKFAKQVLSERGPEGLEELRVKLINDPASLDLTAVAAGAVFTPKSGSADTSVDSGLGRQSVVYRDLATRLSSLAGVKAPVLKQVALWLIDRCGPYSGATVPPDLAARAWALLAQDPYLPMVDVPGYGWQTADAIGRSVGVPLELPRRLAALTEHALGLACASGGHTFQLFDHVCAAVLSVDNRVNPQLAVRSSIEEGRIDVDERGRLYRPEILRAEKRLAEGLAALIQPAEPLYAGTKEQVDAEICRVAAKLGFRHGLDPSQIDAVSSILRSPVRVHTLTGGPGSGKTTVMEVLAQMIPEKEIVFATPTGKAAKVLHARVAKHGLSVATLHATLGCQGEGDYAYGPDEPIEADGFVIDESSMPDILLSDAAVAALSSEAHLVLAGDEEQVQSIGPGRVLRDILMMQGVDQNRLATTHRNKGAILELVNSVRKGEIILEDKPGVWFSHGLADASVQMGEVASAYLDAVHRVGASNVMLIMSRRKGDPAVPAWNTTYANAMLRQMCNPDGRKITGTNLHIADRVIVRANAAYEQRGSRSGITERVVNGDVGTIRGVVMADSRSSALRSLLPEWIDIELDDGRLINLPGKALATLGHAYALTVHSAQGSEYKEVIFVVTPAHANFVNSTMLMTGLSRAQEDLKVFGRDEDLRRIAATPAPERNSALLERVNAVLADTEATRRFPERQRA